jgi:hypothetical protein
VQFLRPAADHGSLFLAPEDDEAATSAERRRRSLDGSASTSGGNSASPQQRREERGAGAGDYAESELGTELVLTLERQGSGWGEEIFPRLSLEQRPIAGRAQRVRNRSAGPDPWTVRGPLMRPTQYTCFHPKSCTLFASVQRTRFPACMQCARTCVGDVQWRGELEGRGLGEEGFYLREEGRR